MAFCIACGASLPENASFCPQCGTGVHSTGASTTTQAPGTSEPGATKTMGAAISDNLAGLLCYTFVAAIIFLLVEPYNRNRFVRFHAFQSILFYVAWLVLHGVVAIPFFGVFLWPVVELAFLIGWIVLLIKAYQGQMFKLPLIGDFAEQHA